ncbi:hypothetical protein M2160_008755 [Streptomyces sp. SAI-117]|uniref:hypothetical protein n=2 Tax=Streptomyces TaxID=1883 RepID=UPI0024765683|nr:hypothetical protein [Streptomyces sp. SAI-117]MDH6573648.1 hypothetical protein [Streptomyces sp. SAI-117]
MFLPVGPEGVTRGCIDQLLRTHDQLFMSSFLAQYSVDVIVCGQEQHAEHSHRSALSSQGAVLSTITMPSYRRSDAIS